MQQPLGYCIAIPNFSSNATLQYVVDSYCAVVNCAAIRPGGNCYLPNVPYSHACYAMNLMFRHNGTCNLQISVLTRYNPCK